jgi:hypothetical protein
MSIQMDLFSGDTLGFKPVAPPTNLPPFIDDEDVAPLAAKEQSSQARHRKVTLPPPSSPPADFAGLMDWLRSGDLAETRNKQMRSALNTFAKVLGKPLRDLPCDPGAVGKLLKEANPILVGVTQARWFGTKSLVRSALSESGVEIMPGRASHPMSPAWEILASRIEDKSGRYGLQRLLRYFTREGIGPGGVDEEAFARFKDALETTGMLTDPATTYYSSVRLWNVAATSVEGWPQFRPADVDRRARYAVSWDTGRSQQLGFSVIGKFAPSAFRTLHVRPHWCRPRSGCRSGANDRSWCIADLDIIGSLSIFATVWEL